MSSTVKNGISLWGIDIKQEKIDGIYVKRITEYPILCDCGYRRKIGAGMWQPQKIYRKLNFIISPIDDNFGYKCMNDGGKSGGVEPIWSTELNSITKDDNIMWECIERNEASYFYHHFYYLCAGCGRMLIGDEEENGS